MNYKVSQFQTNWNNKTLLNYNTIGVSFREILSPSLNEVVNIWVKQTSRKHRNRFDRRCRVRWNPSNLHHTTNGTFPLKRGKGHQTTGQAQKTNRYNQECGTISLISLRYCLTETCSAAEWLYSSSWLLWLHQRGILRQVHHSPSKTSWN